LADLLQQVDWVQQGQRLLEVQRVEGVGGVAKVQVAWAVFARAGKFPKQLSYLCKYEGLAGQHRGLPEFLK
jgi:hypothetical protein